MKELETFKIPDYDGCGVYAIINLADFKAYIGSSANIKERASRHRSALRRGKHNVKQLQKDVDKNLRFVILQKFDADIDMDDLHIIEYVFMIKFMDRDFSLYNIRPFLKKDRFAPKKSKREMIYEIIALHTIGKYKGIADERIKEEFGSYPWSLQSMPTDKRIDISKRPLAE